MNCAIDGCAGKVHAHALCRKHYERKKKHGDPHAVLQIKGDDQLRFFQKVSVSENGCWIWTGAKKSGGYGGFGLSGKVERAHRAAWMIFVGPIPSGRQLNHTCHTPACVNPAHLYPGTPVENTADMDAAGRRNQSRGESHGLAKLDEEAVRAIREDVRPQAVIAKEYGVSQNIIGKVKRRETWRHVA